MENPKVKGLFEEIEASSPEHTTEPAAPVSKVPVTSAEIKQIKPPLRGGLFSETAEELYCVQCGDSIVPEELITYQGMTFHKEHAPFAPVHRPAVPPIIVKKKGFQDMDEVPDGELPKAIVVDVKVGGSPAITFTPTDLKTNPRIDFNLNMRASEIARLIEIIEVDPLLKQTHDKLADILCEHGNLYVRCACCGKVISMNNAAGGVGGIHTKKVKNETGATVVVATGKFYSKARSVEVFCSNACDLNYSVQLKNTWEKEQAEKKASGGRIPKIKDALDQAFAAAKKNPELAEKFAALLMEAAMMQKAKNEKEAK